MSCAPFDLEVGEVPIHIEYNENQGVARLELRWESVDGGIAKQILKFILGKKYDVVGGVTQLGILGSNPKTSMLNSHAN